MHFPPHFDELSFIGNFQTLDFEIQNSGITLHTSQSSGQYLLIEQVPDPDALYNNTIEEIAMPSAIGFDSSDFGPVTAIRVSNRLSKSKRGALRGSRSYRLDKWLFSMPELEKLEVLHFPLDFLRSFAGGKGQSPLAVKETTLTLYPNECGGFKELKAWAKSRAKARLPFKKLEVSLDCSARGIPLVNEKTVHSLRSSLAGYVEDVTVRVLYPPAQ